MAGAIRCKVGNTHLVLTFTFRGRDSGTLVDLTGITNTNFGVTQNGENSTTGARIARTGTGTFTTLPQTGTATLGQVNYQVSAADVATEGRFQLEAYCTFPDATLLISDNVEMEIDLRLAAV